MKAVSGSVSLAVMFLLVASVPSLALWDGEIVAWGANDYGQCDVPSPNEDFVAVAGGAAFSLGLKDDGSIVAWGINDFGQCNVPSPNEDFVAVAVGFAHCLGLKEDGSIVAWGWNVLGQCAVPSPNEDFVAVAAGQHHSLGLKECGSIVAWGDNEDSQCDVPSNEDFVAVAGGYYFSFGLQEDGSIVAWGDNHHSQCDVPFPNEEFVAVAGGLSHCLGIRETSTSVEDSGYTGIEALGLEILSISPNPFDSHTTLTFSSPGLASVTLEVFDLSGRQVHRQETAAFSPGQYTMIWNGTGLRGELLPGGVYLVRLTGGGEANSTRVVLVE